MIRAVAMGLAVVATAAGAASKPAAQAGRAPVAAAKSPAPKVVADAPADEYFGPFKYSAISTRTKIDMLGRSYRERWADDASIVHDAGLVQSSLEAWTQKYPKDRWLAPTAFHLAQLYMEIQTADARNHARAMFEYVAKTYPSTPQGKSARLRLKQGFPPLHDESPVSPTPSPYAPSAANASPAPAAGDVPATPAVPGSTAAPASPASPAPAAAPAASPAPAVKTMAPRSPAAPSSPMPVASAKPATLR
jgi:hypothetical protein